MQSKAVEKNVAELNEKIAQLFSWDATARWAEEMCAEQDESLKARVNVGVQSGQLRGVIIHLDVRDMADAVPIRRAVRQLGYGKPTVSDYAEIQRRSWCYEKEEDAAAPFIHVCAHLPWDEGAHCEYVKVGTKEQPVYELRCGGKPVPKNGNGDA